MNKQKITRILAAILACLIMTSMFIACGNTGDGDGSQATTTQATADGSTGSDSVADESAGKYDDEGFLLDDIPANTNLNQMDITMLYWSDVENPEFFVETENAGDLVGEAIFTRNSRVENRLNVTILYEGQPGNNEQNAAYVSRVRNAEQGGESFDIYASYSMTTANLAYNGFCANLLDYDVLNFEKPWWPKSLTTEATINNKLYFASGDLSTNLLYMMYVLYFNKGMAAEYGLEDPYTCVANNTWTYATMFKMVNDMTDSMNAGAENQPYGFVVNSSVHLDPFFYAAGLRTTERDTDGTPIISPSFGSERAATVVSDVWNFLNKPSCTIKSGRQLFAAGKGLFIMDRARYASQYLSDSGFNYGIVPVPKYTADQASYSTCMGFPYTLYAISNTSEHANEAAIVLECLGSEGFRTITPALFELTMKERYVTDGKASMMFDIIREGVSFDLGRIYASNMGRLTYNVYRGEFVRDGGTQYASTYAGSVDALNGYLAKLMENFQ